MTLMIHSNTHTHGISLLFRHFKIDGGSGKITVKEKFDKPAKYCFAVQAFDSNKQHYGVSQVVVDVKDSNNNKPKFVKDLVQITVQEDEMCNVPIYTPKVRHLI